MSYGILFLASVVLVELCVGLDDIQLSRSCFHGMHRYPKVISKSLGHVPFLRLCCHVDNDTRSSSPAAPSSSMCIVRCICWKIKVYHVCQERSIQAPSCQFGCYDNSNVSLAQCSADLSSIDLFAPVATMKRSSYYTHICQLHTMRQSV